MSQTPPPFDPRMPAPKKNNNGLIILLVVGIVVGTCVLGIAAVSWMGFTMAGKVMPMAGCQINGEAMHDALTEYAKAHEGKLPSAEKWQDELKPYVAKFLEDIPEQAGPINMNRMDVEGPWGCKLDDANKMSGFAFNKELSGMKIDDIPSKATTPIIFEVLESGKNLNKTYVALDPKDAPKIMGETRGWLVVTWDSADFAGSTMNDSNNSGFKVKTDR